MAAKNKNRNVLFCLFTQSGKRYRTNHYKCMHIQYVITFAILKNRKKSIQNL